MTRTQALVLAQDVSDHPWRWSELSRQLAAYILEVERQRETPKKERETSSVFPAAPSGSDSLADAVQTVRNPSGPSGHTSTATLPSVYPMPAPVNEEKIALWLEGHADGYEHGGYADVASALRRRAAGIRQGEYL
jgi:hypothetical protein